MTLSIYYRAADTGYQVVTRPAASRRTASFASCPPWRRGQEAVVSVARGVGQPALELHLHRVGDRVELQGPVS
jgi:hypothetical protein